MAMVCEQLLNKNRMEMKDHYMQGGRLGQGTYGITYLCQKIATSCNYACKCIPKRKLLVSRRQLLQENVQYEIDILTCINLKKHPNIISIEEITQDDDYVYVVMELCEGGTLFDRLIEQETFSESKAANVIKEIVDAIQTCHHNGIIHRDVKLENVLFQTKNEDSKLKLIDFGLSRFFKHGEVLTDVVGTPMYTAPEVLEGHHGPKVDIWSAGVILYTLLVGFQPFIAYTFQEAYDKIMWGDALSFEEDLGPNISKHAKDLVQRMLKIDVNERLSASEVLEHPWIRNNTR